MAENIGNDDTNGNIVPRAPILLFAAGHGETHTSTSGLKMLTRRLRYSFGSVFLVWFWF